MPTDDLDTSTDDLGSSSPTELRAGLDEGKLAGDRLHESILSSSCRDEGSSTKQEVDSGIRKTIEAILEMNRRLDAAEKFTHTANWVLREGLARRDEKFQDILSVSTHRLEAFREVYPHTTILEGVAAGLSSSTAPFVYYSSVDCARRCIVSAFLKIFPKYFKMDRSLPGSNITRTTDMWKIFRKGLNNFYRSFHKEPLKNGNKLVQTRSCFTYLQSTVDKEVSASLQELDQIDEEETDLVKRELDFFLPIFILKFNLAKKALSVVKEKIRSIEHKGYQDGMDPVMAHFLKNDFLNPAELRYPNSLKRFSDGAARSVRAQSAFTSSIQAQTSTVAHRTEGTGKKRKNEDDRDEAEQMNDFWAASWHSPKTRRILSANHVRDKSSSLMTGESYIKSTLNDDQGDTGNGSRKRSPVRTETTCLRSIFRTDSGSLDIVISDALRGQKKEGDEELTQYRDTRSSLLERFHLLRKFLGIVLDGEILRIVLGDPITSSLSEVSPRDRLHGADRAESVGTQALTSRIAQDPIKRLCDVLHHQDDYLEKKLCDIELMIDDAIAGHHAISGSESKCTDDYSILLKKLEEIDSLSYNPQG